MDHRQSGRGRQYLPSEGRGNFIYCRPFLVARLSLPSHFLQYSNICMKSGTGTEFTSNVTSLIVNRGQQVPGCKGGRWPGCSWISNWVNVKSNLYLSVIVYTVRYYTEVGRTKGGPLYLYKSPQNKPIRGTSKKGLCPKPLVGGGQES